MTSKLDDLLPPAKDFMKKIASAEADDAARAARQYQRAEAEKRKLLEQFEKPSGVSDEQRIKRAVVIIERAVRDGKTEVQIIRFPCDLCTVRGRAINQGERGWESTLTGCQKSSMEPGLNTSSRAATNCEARSSVFLTADLAMSA